MTTRTHQKIAVLMGGISAEREVSLDSGRQCAQALRDAGYDVREIDVTADIAVLLELFEGIHAVATHIANGDTALFSIFGRDLGHFLAPFFAQIGDRHPDQIAFGIGVQAQIRIHDRLFHRLERGGFDDDARRRVSTTALRKQFTKLLIR